jgi:hypothetical protein
MSKELYPDQRQRKRINLYKQEMLSVPTDYFDEIRRGLSSELAKGYVQTKVCIAHTLQVAHEIEDLKRIIANQNSRLHKLEQDKVNAQTKVVVLEEVSKEEAKVLVENYFKEHDSADIEELMLNLRIPVQSIVEIVDELRNEGKLVPKGEKEP